MTAKLQDLMSVMDALILCRFSQVGKAVNVTNMVQWLHLITFLTITRKGEELTNQLPPLGRLLADYYEYRGWSEEGLPTQEKMQDLGIEDS